MNYDIESLPHLVSNALAMSLRASFTPSDSFKGPYRVSPPTYAGEREGESRYLLTEREEVRIDSPQSLANRLEARIMHGGVTPSFDVVDGAGEVIVNSRELPHRVFDAALRDSLLGGLPFFKSPLGLALRAARAKTATAIFQHSPETLLFGAWDSHTGGGNQVGKWPRCITGRVFGTSATGRPGAASKGDPLGLDNDAIGVVYKTPDGTMTLDSGQAGKDDKGNPVKFGKGKEAGKLSAAGHGQVITGTGGVDGVDVDAINLQAAVHLGQLQAYEFPSEVASPDRDVAARMALVALAVWSLQATITDSFTLRSGCDLVCESLTWTVRWGLGKDDPIEIATESARTVLAEVVSRLANLGLRWDTTPITLQASPSLLQARTMSAVVA